MDISAAQAIVVVALIYLVASILVAFAMYRISLRRWRERDDSDWRAYIPRPKDGRFLMRRK